MKIKYFWGWVSSDGAGRWSNALILLRTSDFKYLDNTLLTAA